MSDAPPNPKEVYYDAELAPKVQELLELCRAHGLPIFVTVALDGRMRATAYHVPPAREVAESELLGYAKFKELYDVVCRVSGVPVASGEPAPAAIPLERLGARAPSVVS